MAPILISDSGLTRSPIELSNFAVIASYNWLDKPRPTILVSGMPAI